MKNMCLLCLWSAQETKSMAQNISSASPSPGPSEEKLQPAEVQKRIRSLVSPEASNIIVAVESVSPSASLGW